MPSSRRPVRKFIEIKGAKENNLKNIDVRFPLDMLTVVTGVSGSGKSTLVRRILYPALAKILSETSERVGSHASIEGDVDAIGSVEMVDQNPIGKSSRSNPGDLRQGLRRYTRFVRFAETVQNSRFFCAAFQFQCR